MTRACGGLLSMSRTTFADLPPQKDEMRAVALSGRFKRMQAILFSKVVASLNFGIVFVIRRSQGTCLFALAYGYGVKTATPVSLSFALDRTRCSLICGC